MLPAASFVGGAGAWQACQSHACGAASVLGPKHTLAQPAALCAAAATTCGLLTAAVTLGAAKAPYTQRRAIRRKGPPKVQQATDLQDLAEALAQANARAEAAEAKAKEYSDRCEDLTKEVVNLRTSNRRIISGLKIGGTTAVTQAVEAAEKRIEELESELAYVKGGKGSQPSRSSRGAAADLLEAQERAETAERLALEAQQREDETRQKYENDKALVLERARKALAQKEDAKRREKQRRDEEKRKAWEEADKLAEEKANAAALSEMVAETQISRNRVRTEALERVDLDDEDEAPSEPSVVEEAVEGGSEALSEPSVVEEAVEGGSEVLREPSGVEAAGEDGSEVQAERDKLDKSMKELGTLIRKKKEELSAAGKTPEQANKNEAVAKMVKKLIRLKRKRARLDPQEEAEDVKLSPSLEKERQADRDFITLTRERLRRKGYSTQQIDQDPDIIDLERQLSRLWGVDPSRREKGYEWDLPRKHKTHKESLTDWYHRKFDRRTGRAGEHFLNKAAGKSNKEKKRLTKVLLKKKNRKDKVARGKRREEDVEERQLRAEVRHEVNSSPGPFEAAVSSPGMRALRKQNAQKDN